MVILHPIFKDMLLCYWSDGMEKCDCYLHVYRYWWHLRGLSKAILIHMGSLRPGPILCSPLHITLSMDMARDRWMYRIVVQR